MKRTRTMKRILLAGASALALAVTLPLAPG